MPHPQDGLEREEWNGSHCHATGWAEMGEEPRPDKRQPESRIRQSRLSPPPSIHLGHSFQSPSAFLSPSPFPVSVTNT